MNMTTPLEHHLNQARRYFRRGMEAKSRGDAEAARRALLKAAEQLFLAAGLSKGRLKEARTRQAQELLAEAEALTRPTSISRPGRGFPRRTVSGRGSGSKAARVSSEDDTTETWLLSQRPDVSFDDVAGLEDVKEQIRIKLLYPFVYPEQASRYNIEPGGGILLYGPPGTGKTLIARAVAGEIEAAFFAIKPSEIMSQWVGKAEQNLAKLFAQANSHPLSVIFIDEIESLAPSRRTSHSTVMQRVVPQLLAELDGFHKRENALLFIGATNEPWAIDSAILRPGRLDRLIYVPPPDFAARRRILELNLGDVPLSEEVSLARIAARTEGFSGADMAALARRVRERVFTEAIREGDDRPIASADFDAVLAKMSPSIATGDLRRFEAFAAERR